MCSTYLAIKEYKSKDSISPWSEWLLNNTNNNEVCQGCRGKEATKYCSGKVS
jgi:hypothetical protein